MNARKSLVVLFSLAALALGAATAGCNMMGMGHHDSTMDAPSAEPANH